MLHDIIMLISPSDIAQQAKKWFYPYLSSTVEEIAFFPKEIRFGKVKPAWARDRFQELHQSLTSLRQESKQRKGYGYTVTWQSIANRATGENEFPLKITIESEADYLGLLDKGLLNAYEDFKSSVERIQALLPLLTPWVRNNPRKVCQYAGNWPELIEVCRYFLHAYTRDQYYIRELPINVHTKFIEAHKGVISELLTLLLPPSTIDEAYSGIKEHNFEKRYGLMYDETLIRCRSLDSSITGDVSDISIRHSDFAKHKMPGSRVIITENKMNFLTIPRLPDTLAIWGGGFNVYLLRQTHWLQTRRIYYWGDIDAHGFWILSQLRGHYPEVTSLMMDWETFRKFEDGAKGKPIAGVQVSNLTNEEYSLYEHVMLHNLRLEQERVPQSWVLDQIRQLSRF